MLGDALWRERATFAFPAGIFSFLGLAYYLLQTPFEAWSLWVLGALGATCVLSFTIVCKAPSFAMGGGGGETNGVGGGSYDGGCGDADGGHC